MNLSLILFLVGFNSNLLVQHHLLFGNWKLTEIISNGKSIGDVPLNISIQLLPDGRAVAHSDEDTETGRWKIEGEFLVIIITKATDRFRYQLQGNRLTLIKDAEMIILTKQ